MPPATPQPTSMLDPITNNSFLRAKWAAWSDFEPITKRQKQRITSVYQSLLVASTVGAVMNTVHVWMVGHKQLSFGMWLICLLFMIPLPTVCFVMPDLLHNSQQRLVAIAALLGALAHNTHSCVHLCTLTTLACMFVALRAQETRNKKTLMLAGAGLTVFVLLNESFWIRDEECKWKFEVTCINAVLSNCFMFFQGLSYSLKHEPDEPASLAALQAITSQYVIAHIMTYASQ